MLDKLKGMRLFYRDSEGGLIIASYHPAWSLTWSFVLRLAGDYRFFWHRNYTYKRGLYGIAQAGPFYFVRQPTMRLTCSQN